MYHGKTDIRASRIRADHQLRPCSQQVVGAAIAPKRIGQHCELRQQFVIRGDLATTAHDRVGFEGS